MGKLFETYLESYSENDDEKLNDWVDSIVYLSSAELFHRQENWIYMAGEEGDLPQLKENALDYITQVVKSKLSWVTMYIVDRLIAQYRMSNVILNEDAIDMLIEELGEDGYEQWEQEVRTLIFEDYKKALGEKKAIELCQKWWGEDC